MLLENLSYTASNKKVIKIDIDGIRRYVPVDMDNPRYKEIVKQIDEGTIPDINDYSSLEMDLDEFRLYRDEELDRIDTKVANAERWEGFTAQQKTNVRTRKQGLKDLPSSVDLTGVQAGDKAAAYAKFATTPALP